MPFRRGPDHALAPGYQLAQLINLGVAGIDAVIDKWQAGRVVEFDLGAKLFKDPCALFRRQPRIATITQRTIENQDSWWMRAVAGRGKAMRVDRPEIRVIKIWCVCHLLQVGNE